MLTRSEFESIRARLAKLPFAEGLVLVGSSALFMLSVDLPPMTEDTDVAVAERLLLESEELVRTALMDQEFRQVEGTATWVDAAGQSLDLLAFSEEDSGDRAGGPPGMPAMVFSDLGKILRDPRGRIAGKPGTLSPAGLILSKLLTVRLEKGIKDRLHALLLLAENAANPEVLRDFSGLLSLFGDSVLEDVLPEAQAALIAADRFPAEGPAWNVEYASRLGSLRQGFDALRRLLRGQPPC